MKTVARGSSAITRAGVEAAEPEHLRAGEQRAVRGDEEAVHVEDRQGVDQHVALRAARRARGVRQPQ